MTKIDKNSFLKEQLDLLLNKKDIHILDNNGCGNVHNLIYYTIFQVKLVGKSM